MAIENRLLGSGWLEPESAANTDYQPQYPYNNITETESGHLFELDDTPTRERIRLQHRSGTFIEMHPNGDEVHKVYGDGYEITIKDKNVLIQGDCSVTIRGDSVINVEGNKIEKIKGNYELYVEGNYNHVTKGTAAYLSEKDMDIGSGVSLAGAVTGLGGTGTLRLYSGRDMFITGDFRVGGDIVCDSLQSRYSVDAGLGVTAGPLGFVTATGGVSAGVPVAVPGNMICSGAFIGPTAWLGTMTAVWMTDVINLIQHNIHLHPAPNGTTGTPTVLFI